MEFEIRDARGFINLLTNKKINKKLWICLGDERCHVDFIYVGDCLGDFCSSFVCDIEMNWSVGVMNVNCLKL